MKKNRIARYFKQRPYTAIQIAAVVAALVGFCLVWFWGRWALGLSLVFVSLLMFLPISLQTKDEELDTAAMEFQKKFSQVFEEAYIYGDIRKLHQAQLNGKQEKAAIYLSDYLLKSDGLLSRTGKDGKVRTSVYQCVGVILHDRSVCVGVQTMNLIDRLYRPPVMAEWKYRELSGAELLDPVNIHATHMRILDTEGRELIRFQVPADAQSDEIVARVNALVQKT